MQGEASGLVETGLGQEGLLAVGCPLGEGMWAGMGSGVVEVEWGKLS